MRDQQLTDLASSLIARERDYQRSKGYHTGHDDHHARSELAIAAAHLLVHGTDATLDTADCSIEQTRGDVWNLRAKCAGNRLRELTVAAALAVAELEREIRSVVHYESSRSAVYEKREGVPR